MFYDFAIFVRENSWMNAKHWIGVTAMNYYWCKVKSAAKTQGNVAWIVIHTMEEFGFLL